MRKAVGILFVELSTVCFGFLFSHRLRSKLREMEIVCSFWRQFAIELKESMTSPAQLCMALGRLEHFQDVPFLAALVRCSADTENFSLLLKSALETAGFSHEITEAHFSLCGIIGVKPLDVQLLALRQLERGLELEIDRLRRISAAKCPIYEKLGVLAGAMIILLVV